MAVNDSKAKDPRFWIIWESAGAVGPEKATHIYELHIEEAKKWLGYARFCNSDNTQCIDYILESLKKAKAKLEDIGTNIAEIKQLLISGWLAHAKIWLRLTRSCTSDNTSAITNMHEYLKKAGAKLEDIGTNEEELSQLLTKGWLAEAQKNLGLARQRSETSRDYIRWTREALKKAGAKPKDIGSSEAELRELSRITA